MPDDSFFKNIKAVEEFIELKNSILKDEQTEKNASKWVKKHSEYVKNESINPLRFYAGVFYRDPRVLKMIPLAEKLNKKMESFINKNKNKIDKKKLQQTIDNCDKFLLEFEKACGYYFGENEEKITEKLKQVKHPERYNWIKKFEIDLNTLKEYNQNSLENSKKGLNEFKETEKLKSEKAQPHEKHEPIETFEKKFNTFKEYDHSGLENKKETLHEFKEDVLPKIEALVIYKPPISESFKQNNITVSHNVTNNSFPIKKLIKNDNKNSMALTVWKPPLNKQFKNLEHLKQCVIKNLHQIKKAFSDKNSDNGTEIKQFVVKNFSEIKKAFQGGDSFPKIRRSNTFRGIHSFEINAPSHNDNSAQKIEPKGKSIGSDHETSQKNNEKVDIINEKEIRKEDKIEVEKMDLNTIQITYYRALVNLLQNSILSKYYCDFQKQINQSGLFNKFKKLNDFNKEIDKLCKEETNISIMDAIKKLKKNKDKKQELFFEDVKKTFDDVKKTFLNIADYIQTKTKQDSKEIILEELWKKTSALINFNSDWENKSTKNFFEIGKNYLNTDNIKSLKVLYYLRRIFEILNKCVREYKTK